MPAIGETEWREHAALVGEVTLAWNHTVHQLLRIFCHLTGLEDPLASAIFFSHKSDAAQRGMVKIVAQVVGLTQDDLVKLTKLLKRLEEVSSNRNLAAHTIFGVTMFDPETNLWGPKVVPALMGQDKRLEPDFAAQFRRAERTLKTIYDDLEYWLIHTPFPPRAWGAPPFPKAFEANLAAAIAGAEAEMAPPLDTSIDDRLADPSV
ncbi:hypothetical protein [Caulobacter segnis]|uniref:hypothetical protein n=1 Tax=Caulobacter segnis TaxID=88688 RepID=UPI00285DE832|nr:hypothetical protein [Caulobacter segnis]MDR6624470.1 hypothetical protein [Caulobacter segnis]